MKDRSNDPSHHIERSYHGATSRSSRFIKTLHLIGYDTRKRNLYLTTFIYSFIFVLFLPYCGGKSESEPINEFRGWVGGGEAGAILICPSRDQRPALLLRVWGKEWGRGWGGGAGVNY